MPGGVAASGSVCAGTDYGAVTTTSLTTVLTASATTNAKGAWTQLGAALAYDTALLHVNLNCTSAGRAGLIDIGVGPSGSQVVLYSNIPYRTPAGNVAADFTLPVDLRAGTLLWARIQSATASDNTHAIKIDGFSGSLIQQGAGGGEAVGVVTTTSLATTVTGAASTNAKGSYAQLIAATARDYGSIVVIGQPNSANPGLTDFAIGASGSEIVFLGNVASTANCGYAFWLPIAIPGGVRLAARYQSSVASNIMYAAILGIFR